MTSRSLTLCAWVGGGGARGCEASPFGGAAAFKDRNAAAVVFGVQQEPNTRCILLSAHYPGTAPQADWGQGDITFSTNTRARGSSRGRYMRSPLGTHGRQR